MENRISITVLESQAAALVDVLEGELSVQDAYSAAAIAVLLYLPRATVEDAVTEHGARLDPHAA